MTKDLGFEPFECEECGKIDTILVNGYSFGDRLLEDVMFVVKNENGEPKCQGVIPDSQPYFSKLNTTKWIRECERYCETLDVATCGICQENESEIAVWYWIKER